METTKAFTMGEMNIDKELMIFDWIKAAKIIKDRRAKSASAGLSSDWEYTGGEILKNGKPIPEEDTHVYLASTWATPELEVDGVIIDCYIMQSQAPEWNAKTYWPNEALKILNT